ncbi:MAG TPA: fasciclin domain-containing protein [Verrucomicrobiota bacterium]|nr:fasciclin domain-containing protein [Verrucomicrobiota bacterium]HRT06790.1 fasciclin domain-containing protein [Candidatus Paceibacterota bacterium]
MYVNRSQVIQANVDAANGIAHVINRVLLPPAN